MMDAATATSERAKLNVYIFDGTSGADKARHALQALEKQGTLETPPEIAVIRRAAGGAVSIRESADLPFRAHITSALPFVGMVAGYLAHERGMLKTTASVATVIGGTLGLALAVAVNALDLGFADSALMEAGRQLRDGTSALVLLAMPGDEPTISAVVRQGGGTAMEDALGPAASGRIRTALGASAAPIESS